MTRTRIVLVDDDALFLESLGQNLRDAGYDATGFDNGAAAEAHLRATPEVKLILLDWKMPEMNGIELLRRLRDGGVATPVIFLTALGDQIYEETALKSGAVDFVEKSRSFTILKNRIELILGGAKSGTKPDANAGVVELGALRLDHETGRAYWRDKQVELSLTEFRMVALMAARAGREVRYRELYDLVHGPDFVAGAGDQGYRANVRTFIKRIRQKFHDLDANFDAIENYAGFGYRWRDDGGA
jgi:two-component system, OmpR family, response regulator ChvI